MEKEDGCFQLCLKIYTFVISFLAKVDPQESSAQAAGFSYTVSFHLSSSSLARTGHVRFIVRLREIYLTNCFSLGPRVNCSAEVNLKGSELWRWYPEGKGFFSNTLDR